MKQLYGKRKINIKKNLQPYENRTYRFVLPIIKVYGKQLLSLFFIGFVILFDYYEELALLIYQKAIHRNRRRLVRTSFH